jgi:hypothetical protein
MQKCKTLIKNIFDIKIVDEIEPLLRQYLLPLLLSNNTLPSITLLI